MKAVGTKTAQRTRAMEMTGPLTSFMAWMAASRDFPHCSLVTIGMDRVEFRRPAPCGAILRFRIVYVGQGTTSVTYSVDVFSDEPGAEDELHIFSTHVTFVHVGPDGAKRPLPHKDHLRSAQ